MKLGIVVNDTASEPEGYTTTYLAYEAFKRGHEVYYISLQDFSYGIDEQVHAITRRPSPRRYRSPRTYLNALQSSSAVIERISVDQLDVLLLRNDPTPDFSVRPWARLAGINFGRLAMRHGVLVLNDPDGLTHAINKMYLQVFPAAIRPEAIITRDKSEIRDFAAAHGGAAVMKPLHGSGGRNVFLLRLDAPENINQMIEAVLQDGYVIAQEYLPAIGEGDTRLFMMNGQILEHEGAIAAVRRVGSGGDLRSNLTVGGESVAAQVSDEMIKLARQARPRLVQDGMFFVGLDIVGDKVIEINVFSPGALIDASRLADSNFMEAIIVAIERKLAYRQQRPDSFSNLELATL